MAESGGRYKIDMETGVCRAYDTSSEGELLRIEDKIQMASEVVGIPRGDKALHDWLAAILQVLILKAWWYDEKSDEGEI
jgi:hypothetical protein